MRFMQYVNRDGPVPVAAPHLGPCWIWQGAPKKGNGYGQFAWDSGRPEYAHRIMWEMEKGILAPGVRLRHLCGVKMCVNPGHMEARPSKARQEREMISTAALTEPEPSAYRFTAGDDTGSTMGSGGLPVARGNPVEVLTPELRPT